MIVNKIRKPRIYAVPRDNCRFLVIAAVFPVFSGLCRGYLMRDWSFFMLAFIFFSIVAGWLLFLCGKRNSLYKLSTVALFISVNMFYYGLDSYIFPFLASILIVLSAIGWRFNVTPRFLQKRFALPVMNLISAAISLFFMPAVAREIATYSGYNPGLLRRTIFAALFRSDLENEAMNVLHKAIVNADRYIYFLIMLLPLFSLFLVNLATEPKIAEAKDTPSLRTKSMPTGSTIFNIAAWILLAGGIAASFRILIGDVYSVNNFLLSLPLVAAGILLVIRKDREKRFLAAIVCLTISAAPSFFDPSFYSDEIDLLLFYIPILLMLISAIGAVWNISPKFLSKITVAPILNLLAALLLVVFIWNTISFTLWHNRFVYERNDIKIRNAAEDAGTAAATAVSRRESATEAIDDAYSDYKAEFKKLTPQEIIETFETVYRLNAENIYNGAVAASNRAAQEAYVSDDMEAYDAAFYETFIAFLDEAYLDFDATFSGIMSFVDDFRQSEPEDDFDQMFYEAYEELLVDLFTRYAENISVGALETINAIMESAEDLDGAITEFVEFLNEVNVDAAEAYEDEFASRSDILQDRSASTPQGSSSAPSSTSSPADDALRKLVAAGNSAETDAKNAAAAVGKGIESISLAEDEIKAAIAKAKNDSVAWYVLFLNLLPAAGLAVLNISVGKSEAVKLGVFSAIFRFCRRIHLWFYRDVGGKLQMLAKVQGVVCLVIAFLSAIIAVFGVCGGLLNYFFIGSGFQYLTYLVYGISGIAASFILAMPTWLMYAFGQITKDLREVKDGGTTGIGISGPNYKGISLTIENNPDELPEL